MTIAMGRRKMKRNKNKGSPRPLPGIVPRFGHVRRLHGEAFGFSKRPDPLADVQSGKA